MTYSTGSGSFDDLMAAIVTHAVADGWTATAGDWPITSPLGQSFYNYRVDYSISALDVVNGGNRSFTEQVCYFTLIDRADKSRAWANGPAARCVHQPILEYHLFSNPDLVPYIHAVWRTSDGPYSDLWHHASIGHLDPMGFSCDPVPYVGASNRRNYVPSAFSADSSLTYEARDWSGGNFYAHQGIFSGVTASSTPSGYRDGNHVSFSARTNFLNTPVPSVGFNLSESGPAQSEFLQTYVGAIDSTDFNDSTIPGNSLYMRNSEYSALNSAFLAAQNLSRTDLVLADLPVFLLDSNAINTVCLGRGPDFRACNIANFAPGQEVTIGTDVWKVFPLLRKSPLHELARRRHVASGNFGFAVKKVL